MPRELPQREVAAPRQHSYYEKEGELKKKKVENIPSRWSGVEKKPVSLPTDQVQIYSDNFKKSVAALKNLASFTATGSPPVWAEPLKQRTQNARGDLSGLWYDVKQEVASRSAIDVNLNTTLDWLELAERQGGLSTWLEQWNGMFSSPWSWDMLAESVEKIKRGIEFCKAIVNEGFRDESSSSKNLKNRNDLLFALDAIASEITREADTLLSAKQVDMGRPFDAMAERLKDVSLRAGIEGRLHSAFEKGNLHEAWVKEIPDAIGQKYGPQIVKVSQALKTWRESARDFEQLVSASHQAQDEMDAANDLDKMAQDLGNEIDQLILPAYATSNSSAGNDPDQYSILLHVCKRLAMEVGTQNQNYSKRLTAPQAISKLNGFGTQKLLEIDFEGKEPKESTYYSSREFAAKGKLADFWRQGKVYVDKITGSPGLADKLEKAGGQDLGSLLTRWTKRKSGESYTLAWQLIATLRNLKQRTDTVLQNPPERAFMTNALDAIANAITIQVRQEANSV